MSGGFNQTDQEHPSEESLRPATRFLPFRFAPTKFLPLQPPNQLETLDDLLAQAEHYAGFCMRNSGKMSPTLFLIGADGPLMFVPASLADENEKDDFATNSRLVCIAHAATAVVMALEAWMKTATPGEKFDMTEPPSEAFDRQEVIVLMGESHTGQKQKFLPIIRSGNGKFFGVGEPEVPEMDEMNGRFAQLLPTKIPDAELREVAKVMLKVKGVGRAMPGTTPSLPRSRC
jgi:hypothetical protein